MGRGYNVLRGSHASAQTQLSVICYGRLAIDLHGRRLLRDGQDIHLTRTEWALLEELICHAGTTLTYATLLQHVWGSAYGAGSAYVHVYISRLRHKLEDDPATPCYLHTEVGIGYRFTPPEPVHNDPSTPPTRTLTPTSTDHLSNLPTPLTSFIGHEREVAVACALLRRTDVRLLTFTGAPGIGKTRLGLQVAAHLRDGFRDGVFFVALAPIRDPALVIEAIRATIGITEAPGQPLVNHLKQSLYDKELLLMLDNFEQVLGAGPPLAELLAVAPQLKALITSRAALHVYGEHEFRVPPLALPDLAHLPTLELLQHYPSVALFTARAQMVMPDFALTHENAPAVAAICARLDGLPLAIELAAARMKLFTPQAILSRRDRHLEWLTGGAPNLPVRHQTLRGAIAWSYELLNAEERTLFARLAVFVSGCTIEAAEALCRDQEIATAGRNGGDADQVAPIPRLQPPASIQEGLASLLDKSLLQQTADPSSELRLVMLETIRAYALEQLALSGEVEVFRQRHALYYLRLAEAAEPELIGPQARVWLDRLEREHDNLRAALHWALEQGAAAIALQLSGAVWRFWWAHGHLREGRRWLEAALTMGRAAPAAIRMKALAAAGALAGLQGDNGRSAALLEESLMLGRAQGCKQSIAYTLGKLGCLAYDQGEYERAKALYAESLALFRDLGDRRGIAVSLNNMGDILREHGDYGGARILYEESLALIQEWGNKRDSGICLSNLGAVALAQGDCARARTLFKESLVLEQEQGDTAGIILNLERLAELAAGQGKPMRVARLYGAATALRERFGIFRPRCDQARYERSIAAVRAQLDEATWLVVWAAGRATPLDQMITEALADDA